MKYRYLNDIDCQLFHGDVLDVLRELPDESVDCVVTSPPYWGLRDYGTGEWEGGDETCDHVRDIRKYAEGCIGCGVPMQEATAGCGHCADRHAKRVKHGTPPDRNYDEPPEDHWERPRARDQVTAASQVFADVCGKCGARRVDQQIGLEPTPDLFVESLVAVFREVRRVLAPHGTVWCNLGDSYAAGGGFAPDAPSNQARLRGESVGALHGASAENYMARATGAKKPPPGLKQKDLVGIPWRVAFALQADGWWLRSDIVWSKPNPMPESVTDRPTKAHEYVFLLTKQPKYFFDQEAVREPAEWQRWGDQNTPKEKAALANGVDLGKPTFRKQKWTEEELEARRAAGRNIRTVWTVATQPYPEAHFATYPEELVRRCVLAGCPVRVCRTCGKPADRIVDTEREWHREPRGDRKPRGIPDGPRQNGRATLLTETVGWSDCGHNDYRAGVVLDPFVGSGTTCQVARDHGRHSVGIDLNADYLELASRRLQQQSLFSEAAS